MAWAFHIHHLVHPRQHPAHPAVSQLVDAPARTQYMMNTQDSLQKLVEELNAASPPTNERSAYLKRRLNDHCFPLLTHNLFQGLNDVLRPLFEVPP